MVAACIALVSVQVYLDLRIPEYMSDITYHLPIGTGTGTIVDDGERMLACALASFALAMCTAVLAARVSAVFCGRLRTLMFSSVGSFSKQDIDGFSAASLITRSTNDVYQIQQFMPRAITVVSKAPLIAVLAIWKISGSAYEWSVSTVVAIVVMTSAFSVMMYRGMPYIRRMQWYVDVVNHITREGLEGTRGIRAYNAEPHHERRLEEASGKLLDNSVSLARVMSPMHALSSSMMNFLILAIYWLGAGIIMSSGSQDAQMRLFSDMMVFTSYAAYIFTKQNMWGHKVWYRFVVVTMYFSAGMIPIYMNNRLLGLTNTFWIYVIPLCVSVYNMVLVKTSIEAMSPELEESAYLDGAGYLTRFFRIVLPLQGPILATVSLFTAVNQWNDFFTTQMYVTNTKLYTLQFLLYELLNQVTAAADQIANENPYATITPVGIRLTLTAIVTIPIICVYPFVQKFYVKGIMVGAVKG